MIKWLLAAASILILSCGSVKEQRSDVKIEDYKQPASNPVSIYDTLPSKFISPFSVNIDNYSLGPIKKSVEVNIKNTEDYRKLELQLIDTRGDDKPVLLLHYAGKKRTDAYFTPGLTIDRDLYKGLFGDAVFSTMDIAHKINTDNGLKAEMKSVDKYGNDVFFRITENPDTIIQFSEYQLPLSNIVKPMFLPVILHPRRNNVSVANTSIEIRTKRQNREPLVLGIPEDEVLFYDIQYSEKPAYFYLNKNYSGIVAPLAFKGSAKPYLNDVEFILDKENGYPEIVSIKSKSNGSTLNIDFSPAFPDVTSLKDGIALEGKFAIHPDGRFLIAGGDYTVKNNNGIVEIELIPLETMTDTYNSLLSQFRWKGIVTKVGREYKLESAWYFED